jgi:hypothetical protein
MNGSADLERRYRRLLAWYPRSFRAENEEEILAVLLECAQDGQTRPDLAATADLLKGALWMWLRPPGYPPRALIAAVRLMLLGAVVEVGALVYLLVGGGSIKAAFRYAHPGATATQWHALSVHLTADQVAAPVVIVLWLWLAWFTGRGHDYGRVIYIFFYVILALGLLLVLGADAVRISPAGVAIDATSCAIGLAALVLIFTPQTNRYFERLSPQPASAAR